LRLSVLGLQQDSTIHSVLQFIGTSVIVLTSSRSLRLIMSVQYASLSVWIAIHESWSHSPVQ